MIGTTKFKTHRSTQNIAKRLNDVIEKEKLLIVFKKPSRKEFSGYLKGNKFCLKKRFFYPQNITVIRGKIEEESKSTLILLRQSFCMSVRLAFLALLLVLANFIYVSRISGLSMTFEICFTSLSILIALILIWILRIYEWRTTLKFLSRYLNISRMDNQNFS